MECCYFPEAIKILNSQSQHTHVGIVDSDEKLTGVLLAIDEYRLMKHLSDLACSPPKYKEIFDENVRFQREENGVHDVTASLAEALRSPKQKIEKPDTADQPHERVAKLGSR